MASTRHQLEHAERDKEIVRMRADSVEYRIIAEKYGISESRVCQIWRRALRTLPATDLPERRAEQDQFIDRMIAKLILDLLDPQSTFRSRAETSKVINLWEQRRAALLGLDAPRRREVELINGSTIDRAVAELTTEMRTTNTHQNLLTELNDIQ